MPRFLSVFTAFVLLVCSALPAYALGPRAVDRAAFLQSVRGVWSGKGQVVAGRYKGTKFSCNFTAPSSAALTDMQLNGACRTGIFSQPIKASISGKGDTFQGSFNEGAQANGLDIVAGRVEKNRLTLELNREKLKGHMTARLVNDNSLNIVLAVKIDDEIIPVIDMNLTRAEPAAVTVAAKGSSLFAWLSN